MHTCETSINTSVRSLITKEKIKEYHEMEQTSASVPLSFSLLFNLLVLVLISQV